MADDRLRLSDDDFEGRQGKRAASFLSKKNPGGDRVAEIASERDIVDLLALAR